MTRYLRHALILAVALTTIGSSLYAQKMTYRPFSKRSLTPTVEKAPARNSETTVPFEVVAEEHFSKFSAGTETEPDKTLINGTENSEYEIKPEYLESPGWTGNAIWQAGGACYLHSFEQEWYGTQYGHISTKEMALYGDLKITFRAKRAANASENTNLWIAVCDNYSGPVDEGKEFFLTTEWTEYEYLTDRATFNDYNIVQFVAYDGELLIDDIKIERAKTKIATPYMNDVINNSTTSFTASWSKVEEATEYLFSVYYMDYPEDYIPAGSITEDFEGVKSTDGLVDTSAPGYTEGWTIDVSTHQATENNEEVCTTDGFFNSGKQSIILSEVDDCILSPITPAPISKISFWCRPSSMEQEDWMSLSMICVQVLVGDTWEYLGNLPNYYFQEKGGIWEMEYPVIPAGATQLKIFYLQQGKVKFYIDDVTVYYETQTVPYELITDHAVTDTCFTVSYNSNFEHYCYVKARNSQAKSEKSYTVWVDGLNGLKPIVKEASDISSTSFTANWEPMPNAQNYKVSLSKMIAGSGKEEVVLHETFDGVKTGSIDYPTTSYTTIESLGSLGYAQTDWMIQLPQYAEGMAGAQAANTWSGIAGVVGTPKLNLDSQSGKFNVKFKAYMTAGEDVLWVMLLNEVSDIQAAAGYPVQFTDTKAGYLEGDVLFDKSQLMVNGELAVNLKNIRIGFMSQLGMPFFIDEVTITQTYAEGESVIVPYCIANTDQPFYKFENLDEAPAYAYSVSASAEKDFYPYASNESDVMVVSMSSGVEDAVSEAVIIEGLGGNVIVNSSENINVQVYNTQGMVIASANNVSGYVQIPCAQYKGQLLIVKAGSKVAKIVVK